jgi:hypothetical protein
MKAPTQYKREDVMFKRVKTIGLLGIGLLAMLGTKAEAHYMYVNGKWVYHSIGCQATIGSLSDPPDRLVVECVVDTAVVETLCPDMSIVSLPIQVRLVAQVLITPGQAQVEEVKVEVIVSDAPLLNVNLNPSCGDSTPTDVLIRNMDSTISIFQCAGPVGDPCSVRLLTSIAAAQCELPAKFKLDNYPKNLPPDGTRYTCTYPVIEHVN